jgi:hypothetical protein
MDLEFTGSSAGRLRERKVLVSEVELTISEPDDVVPTDTDRTAYIKNIGRDEFVTVIVDPNTDPLVVVTLWVEPPR